ncbi:MAG: fumarylacetoacetate hydrolase family protein [Ktedonobacteraceae bacterium]
MQLIRYISATGGVALGLSQEGDSVRRFAPESITLRELLRLSSNQFRQAIEEVSQTGAEVEMTMPLAPIDGETEVWAAGVTYERSEVARREESETPDIYSKVYSAARPELFFKASARRVVGSGGRIAVRTDSTWDVPEPELAVVINAHGEIVGYCIGNDVSSRSIEGENPLYLPQAKVYAGSCALGPGITPAWEISDAYALAIHMSIERAGREFWTGETSTRELHRKLDDLVTYLYREDDFPDGAILCTGTALVPDHPFTLEVGDVVHIRIDGLGSLSNSVVRGKAELKSGH